MKTNILCYLLLALLATANAFAATNYVLNTYDFQTNITAAHPGDTFIVQGGTYNGAITFSSPCTILCAATNAYNLNTNPIQFSGAVNIQGNGAYNFSQCHFLSPVQIQCAGIVGFAESRFQSAVTSQVATLLLSRVTALSALSADLGVGSQTSLEAYDSSLASVNVIGGKVALKRCTLAGLSLSGDSAFEGLRVTNTSSTIAIASGLSATPFTAVQSSFSNSLVVSGYKVWLGYDVLSSPGWTLSLTNCDSVLIGNTAFTTVGSTNGGPYTTAGSINGGIYLRGAAIKAYNNLILGSTTANCPYSNDNFCYNSTVYGFLLDYCSAEIANNTIVLTVNQSRGPYSAGDPYGKAWGILLTNASGVVTTIRANIVAVRQGSGSPTHMGNTCIEAVSPQTAEVSYCDFWNAPNVPGPLLIGVEPVANCMNNEPQLNGSFLPNMGSPCVNAGPPDPIYADRDRTRNDMGYTGGPYYTPANYTNNNPMVFFLTGSPQNVFKGQQNSIQINAAASAGH